MAPPDDLPSPRETFLAYAVATASSLVWIACVVPGVDLAEGGIPNDHATPMARATMLIVPALLFLVAGPVGAVLARNVSGYRALLAASNAFISFFFAGALWFKGPHDLARILVTLGLVAVGIAAVIECVRAARVEEPSEPADGAPSEAEDGEPDASLDADRGPEPSPADSETGRGGWQLALSILILLTPASLLAEGGGERASYLAPFAFVAVSALGGRLGRTLTDLRLTTALLLVILAAHLAISVRYALNEGLPHPLRWTAAGWVAFGLTFAVFALASLWAGVLVARRRRLA